MNKSKILETSLVLTTAFLVIFFFNENKIFIYIAAGFGGVGIFIKPLAKYIAIGWFKLADILNFVFSKVILGAVYFFVLFPISLLYRMSKKDILRIKRTNQSVWEERNYQYSSKDLENIW